MRKGPGASPMRAAPQGKAKKNIGKRRSIPGAFARRRALLSARAKPGPSASSEFGSVGKARFRACAPGRPKRPLGAMIVWRFGLPALSARFPNIKRDTEKKRRKRQRGKGQAQEDNQDGSSPWRCGAAHPGLGRAGRARLIRPRLGCALGKKRERLIRRPLPATARRRRPRTTRSAPRAAKTKPGPGGRQPARAEPMEVWLLKAPGPKGRENRGLAGAPNSPP